jgi:hypothetical protein
MIQGLDSCLNSGVEVVSPRLVVLLECQHLSASTDNFSVKTVGSCCNAHSLEVGQTGEKFCEKMRCSWNYCA